MYAPAIIVATACFVSAAPALGSDSFTEELILKPLYGNQIYAHFHFKTRWDIDVRKDSGKYRRTFALRVLKSCGFQSAIPTCSPAL